jgi:hypothetical protein
MSALPNPLDLLEERLHEIMRYDSWESREGRAHGVRPAPEGYNHLL